MRPSALLVCVHRLEAISVPDRPEVTAKRALGAKGGVNRYAFRSDAEIRAAMTMTFLVLR